MPLYCSAPFVSFRWWKCTSVAVIYATFASIYREQDQSFPGFLSLFPRPRGLNRARKARDFFAITLPG